MKANSLKTAALLAGTIGLLAGNATAQATTGVVGYETLDLNGGFNFVGVRLHETPVASGTLESGTAGPNTVTDDDVDLGGLITSGTYILEIEDGSGIIQEITAAGAGTEIATGADLSGLGFPVAYTLRPASTVASIFGAANESGLVAGNSGEVGADQIWLWNGAGFDKYYYDDLEPVGFSGPAWVQFAPGAAAVVNPADIDLIYADGFVINAAGVGPSVNSVVVTGDLKSGATELNLASPFSFVGSVAPVGATLETTFGAANSGGLTAGNSGEVGADQIWLWNGAGFDKYYYDDLEPIGFSGPAWVQFAPGAPTLITPSTVSMDSGYVMNGPGGNVVSGVPAYYAGL